jgi:hypothetical protein
MNKSIHLAQFGFADDAVRRELNDQFAVFSNVLDQRDGIGNVADDGNQADQHRDLDFVVVDPDFDVGLLDRLLRLPQQLPDFLLAGLARDDELPVLLYRFCARGAGGESQDRAEPADTHFHE